MLFGCRTTRRRTVKYNGKVYKYDLDPPRRYYRCYGVQKFRLNCRNRSYIRAERLEELVWGQVKRVVQDRDLLIAGIDALDTSEDGEMAKQVARAERDLQNIQLEEDRAIRLYVSGKITESQLDHQRKFITERLENLRAKLDDYRARESAEVERRVLMEYVLEWAEKVGEGLDDLPSEERRDVLQILLDRVMIDRDNNVVITLGIPTYDLVAIGNPEPASKRALHSDLARSKGRLNPLSMKNTLRRPKRCSMSLTSATTSSIGRITRQPDSLIWA